MDYYIIEKMWKQLNWYQLNC